MIINPKTYTLDELDRAEIIKALENKLSAKRRMRHHLTGRTEWSRKAIENNEKEQARIEDLITRFTS